METCTRLFYFGLVHIAGSGSDAEVTPVTCILNVRTADYCTSKYQVFSLHISLDKCLFVSRLKASLCS